MGLGLARTRVMLARMSHGSAAASAASATVMCKRVALFWLPPFCFMGGGVTVCDRSRVACAERARAAYLRLGWGMAVDKR